MKSSTLMPDVARNLAKEGFLFGLPLVMFEKQFDYQTYTTKVEETRSPVNQFVHYRRFVDASNRLVVGFNVDNLYSFASLDLAAEPLVLSIPKMDERYWLMQLIDGWNGVPAAPGSRTHGGARPHNFLIVAPDWEGVAPDGMDVLRSPTNLAMIGGRTYCAGAKDYAVVNQLQDQYVQADAAVLLGKSVLTADQRAIETGGGRQDIGQCAGEGAQRRPVLRQPQSAHGDQFTVSRRSRDIEEVGAAGYQARRAVSPGGFRCRYQGGH